MSTNGVVYVALANDAVARTACEHLTDVCGAKTRLIDLDDNVENCIVLCTHPGAYPGPGGFVKELTPRSLGKDGRGFKIPAWADKAERVFGLSPDHEFDEAGIRERFGSALCGIHMRLTSWRPSQRRKGRVTKVTRPSRRGTRLRELLDS